MLVIVALLAFAAFIMSLVAVVGAQKERGFTAMAVFLLTIIALLVYVLPLVRGGKP